MNHAAVTCRTGTRPNACSWNSARPRSSNPAPEPESRAEKASGRFFVTARTTRSGRCSSRIQGRSPRPPSQLTPATSFSRSSSTIPTMSYGVSPASASSSITSAPPSAAPTISTRRRDAGLAATTFSQAARNRNTAPVISSSPTGSMPAQGAQVDSADTATKPESAPRAARPPEPSAGMITRNAELPSPSAAYQTTVTSAAAPSAVASDAMWATDSVYAGSQMRPTRPTAASRWAVRRETRGRAGAGSSCGAATAWSGTTRSVSTLDSCACALSGPLPYSDLPPHWERSGPMVVTAARETPGNLVVLAAVRFSLQPASAVSRSPPGHHPKQESAGEECDSQRDECRKLRACERQRAPRRRLEDLGGRGRLRRRHRLLHRRRLLRLRRHLRLDHDLHSLVAVAGDRRVVLVPREIRRRV